MIDSFGYFNGYFIVLLIIEDFILSRVYKGVG